jgi:hypothetical protein
LNTEIFARARPGVDADFDATMRALLEVIERLGAALRVVHVHVCVSPFHAPIFCELNCALP